MATGNISKTSVEGTENKNADPISTINKIPVKELLVNLKVEINKLIANYDMNQENATYLVKYVSTAIKRANSTKEHQIFNLIVEIKFIEVYRKILSTNYSELSKDQNRYAQIYPLISAIWSATDKSERICKEFLRARVYKDYIVYLKDLEKRETPICLQLSKSFLVTTYNVLMKCSAAREPMRSVEAVNVCQSYRSHSDPMLKLMAILAQAYMLTEAENDKLNSEKSVFVYLLEVLTASLKGVSHGGVIFSIDEILQGINMLAVNDNNKKNIIDAGALNFYVELMKPGHSEEVIALAAHGIWILAFKCKEQIIKYDGCIQTLKTLLTHSNKQIVKEAEGALWILQDKAAKTANDVSKTDQHVFISYQWDSKKLVLKVRDHLKRAGIKTWIDDDDMSGSIMEAMALAVEKASIVLVCYSQKYKDSPNCRSEAEYTFQKRKAVIPLRMETNYVPDGWLGILIANKLYFDVSVEAKYDDSVKNLLKEISKLKAPGSDIVDGPAKTTPKVTMTHEKSNPVRNWSKKDIDAWIQRNNMKHLEKIFDKFDGNMLIEFAQLKEEAPEAFYASFNAKNYEVLDLLLIKKALKEIQ